MNKDREWWKKYPYTYPKDITQDYQNIEAIVIEAIHRGERQAFATIPNPSYSKNEVDRLVLESRSRFKEEVVAYIQKRIESAKFAVFTMSGNNAVLVPSNHMIAVLQDVIKKIKDL